MLWLIFTLHGLSLIRASRFLFHLVSLLFSKLLIFHLNWENSFHVFLIFFLSWNISQREKCPNTELFLVHIQFKYEKIRTRKNSVFGHFSRIVSFLKDTDLNLSWLTCFYFYSCKIRRMVTSGAGVVSLSGVNWVLSIGVLNESHFADFVSR